MITSRLETPVQSGDLFLGPVDHLKIVGKSLQLPDGVEVAIHQAGMWLAKGICFISVQFDCQVFLEFGHTEFPMQEQFGPYPALRIVDGALWPGSPPELIARFDDTLSAWHIYARPAGAMNILTIRGPG